MKTPYDKNDAFYGSKNLRERIQKECKPIFDAAAEIKRIIGKQMLVIPVTHNGGRPMKYLDNKSLTKF